MTSPVVTVAPQTPVKQAAALLADRGFVAAPVVESGRLIGILTEADLVRDRITPDPRSMRRGRLPPPGDLLVTGGRGDGHGGDHRGAGRRRGRRGRRGPDDARPA